MQQLVIDASRTLIHRSPIVGVLQGSQPLMIVGLRHSCSGRAIYTLKDLSMKASDKICEKQQLQQQLILL